MSVARGSLRSSWSFRVTRRDRSVHPRVSRCDACDESRERVFGRSGSREVPA